MLIFCGTNLLFPTRERCLLQPKTCLLQPRKCPLQLETLGGVSYNQRTHAFPVGSLTKQVIATNKVEFLLFTTKRDDLAGSLVAIDFPCFRAQCHGLQPDERPQQRISVFVAPCVFRCCWVATAGLVRPTDSDKTSRGSKKNKGPQNLLMV